MKILLIGEYSRLHNSLKEGLLELGHDVLILGYSDSFKAYPVDFKLQKKWHSGWQGKVKTGIYLLTGFDLSSWLTYRDFQKIKPQFAGFDIVQLINENSFYCEPFYEKKILRFLFEHNEKVFLLSCGDDCVNVAYNFTHPESKSVVQPYLMGKIRDKNFLGVLKFRKKSFQKLHDYIYENMAGVIATDLDYHLPLINHPKYLGLVPNPVNVKKIAFLPIKISGKINIFLGINHESYFKKGIDYFEKALEIIQDKYPEKVNITVSRSIPYDRYIRLYDDSHILLDQAFAKDQGYNALEAMAKGKVVFTGAEEEFVRHYQLSGAVAVNAVPSVEKLVKSLESLIENPAAISAIGKRARSFIEYEHDYIKIAGKYLSVWKSS